MNDDRLRRRFEAHLSDLDTRLTSDERAKLMAYVAELWDMAHDLHSVDHPGLSGNEKTLPRQYAWANFRDSPPPTVAESLPAAPTRGEPPAPHIHTWPIAQVSAAVSDKAVTPTDLVEHMLDRIERLDGQIRSYITVAAEQARNNASQLTKELYEGRSRGPLSGIVLGVKDNIPVAGIRCTCNSRLLEEWTPKRDAVAVWRLRQAGAVIIGKHNLNEFGWSIPSEADLAPPPKNPWFLSEYSVGSTSGGGAATAAGLCYAAIGTDGGGSVRLPAGQHLLVGIKPTHGSVPRTGYTSGSVSDIGVLARSALDAAVVLAALMSPEAVPAGPDIASWQVEKSVGVSQALTSPRLGIPVDYIDAVGMEEDVRTAFDSALARYRALGAEVVEISGQALRHLAHAVKANFVVIAAEHHSSHQRTMAANSQRYGTSSRFYNLPGAFLSASDLLNARRTGEVLRDEVDAALRTVDMLVMPTSPVTKTSDARNPKTHRRGGNAAYTAPFNLSGHPAVSVPIGLSSEGIPIGLQLVGRQHSEFILLQAAHTLMEVLALPKFPFLHTED